MVVVERETSPTECVLSLLAATVTYPVLDVVESNSDLLLVSILRDHVRRGPAAA